MKKTFTLLIAALLCCVGVVKAAVTDLPEMSKNGDIKWYTISNTRSTSGKYLFWTENGVKDDNSVTAASLFYFTGTADACYIHNAKTENLFSGTGAWTSKGVACKISETPHSSKAGLAIEFNGTALNEQNYDNGYTTWSANDAGSVFVMVSATTSIEDFIAAIEENKVAGNTILGQYKYEESTYNELVTALATLKSSVGETAVKAFDKCQEIIAGLPLVMPEPGKFYVIECPLFYNASGVKKGLYVTEEGNLGWNTTNLKNNNCYWTVEEKDGTYALKNYGTGTYLNGTSMSESAAYATLTALGEKQFNIIVNGTTVHANGHSSGTGNSGNIVHWGGAAGSASAWKFVEKGDPATLQEVVVRYSFTADGEKQLTQETTTFVGEEWPTFELPYGVSATKLEGVIGSKDVVDGKVDKEIELTITLPFEAAARVESISTWYYLQMHSNNKKYIEYLNGESYLAWEDQEVDMNDADKYVWAFVGNVFDGFKLVNKAGTTAMAMKSTGSGEATMDTYANGTAFVLAATSTGAEGGFCLRYPDNNQYLNAQNGKVAHWSATDAGSTIFATDISAYISSVKEEALATLAQYAASPLVFDQNLVSKAIETVKALSETETSTVNKANAEVAAVIEDAESKTYTFQTKATDNHRSGVWVSANATTGKAIGAHSFDNNAIWSLKIVNANTFYIYNRLNKTYIGNPGNNCPLTADPTTAYSLEVVNGTLVELKHNGETLHASNHNDDKLLNWDGNEDASRWYMTFYAMDYEADILLTGNASMIKPSLSSEGTPNAEFETHVVDDQLTIYTSYCHWSEELTLVNKPYKASFYSNELSKAIKSIRFEASSNKEETLIFYGSNDGEEWTLVETEVTVPCTIEDGIADFTGTAFNYFKVTTKGYNPVSIKKIIIEFDPQVELPVIVDVPSFSVVGGNMYIPAYLRLYAEEGATIYWSTDGKNYKKYTNYIVIDKTCTIYAYAMIGDTKSEVFSQTYVMATEYDNIGALLATEATETGIPVIVNLQAIITAMSKQQMTIADNTGELYITDKYIPSHYAVKDSLTGQLSGVYKLIEGVPTVSEISYTLITHKEYTPADFFMIGEATKTLEMDKWYLLKSEGRNAYVNETDKDLRMVSAANYAGVVAMEGNMGMLFKFSESKTEGYYNIISAKGHYFSVAQSSSTISATAVDYIVKNVTGSTFYMQNPANNIVVDANAIGGTFVGWGTTVPTAPGGNNCYQFIEVDLVNADQAESILKAKTILYDLQQAYGLVTSASQYSSNAVEPTEGSLANLLDNDYTTFFHSTWSSTAEDTHYLQAEVSEPTNSIFFYFKKRSQNDANRPTNITILGSNDGVEFTEITTINSGLPTNAEVPDYTSDVITTSESYKYFRFKVNATNNNATEGKGHPFFTFSEFYLFPGNSNLIDLMEAAKLFTTVNPTDRYFNELKEAFNALVNTDINESDYPVLVDEFYEIYNKLGTSEDPTDPEIPTDPEDPEDPETPTDPVDPEDPEDNPETGIINAENCDKPIVVYTITGKAIQTTVGKLQNLDRGIYIIDGKKKMVK